MEQIKAKLNIKEIGIQKLIIIFLCGVFLIVISLPDILSFGKSGKSSNNNAAKLKTTNSEIVQENENTQTAKEYTSNLENRLEEILRNVSGIGNVEVMITLKSSKELVTLKDEPYTEEKSSESDSEGGSRTNSNINKEDNTVLITADDGSTLPYVTKEIEPEIEGVIVIAEGAENASVINDIMDAVLVLFDVPAHKIKVMKMN